MIGGSKGDRRLFRLGYTDPSTCIAVATTPLWRGLERDERYDVAPPVGQITFGGGERPGPQPMGEAGAECSEMIRTRRRRWPATGSPAPVYEPASGVLAASECLIALTSRFLRGSRHDAKVAELADDGRPGALSGVSHARGADRVVSAGREWPLLSSLGVDAHLAPRSSRSPT